MSHIAAPCSADRKKLVRRNTVFDSADIVMFANASNNLCCGIFKNPADHMTHFYRKRYKAVPGPADADEAPPLELRNLSASMKLWGKHWDRIQHVKLCRKPSSQPLSAAHSKWSSLLEDQRADCQNRFGCRISLMDFESLNSTDKKVMNDLLDKIVNVSVSEDDLIYFNLQDDSDAVDNLFFDL